MAYKLAILGLALVLLSACAGTPRQAASPASSVPPPSSTPAAPPTAAFGNDDEGADIGELDPDTIVTLTNRYLKISYDHSWQLIGHEGPEAPAFISLQRLDHLATLTIRVTRQRDSLEKLCHGAAKVFAAEGAQITQGPDIRGPNCRIRGIKNERDIALWLRKDRATGLAYSINYHGLPQAANQVLRTLRGDINIQELLIAPL